MTTKAARSAQAEEGVASGERGTSGSAASDVAADRPPTDRRPPSLVALRCRDGALCMRIILAETGPVVEVSSRSLQVSTNTALSICGNAVDINVRNSVRLRSGGALEISADGNVGLAAGGAITAEASSIDQRARWGNVEVRGARGVVLDGGAVRLNSPDGDP